MKQCTSCETENPSSAKFCWSCGHLLSPEENLSPEDKLKLELIETKKSKELLEKALKAQLDEEKPDQIPYPKEQKEKNPKEESDVVNLRPIVITTHPTNDQNVDKKNNKNIALIALLSFLALSVFGLIYYKNIYIPAKIDREAPRYYTFAESVVLRSSAEAGVEHNRIRSLGYGSELITYKHNENGWSSVKDSEKNKGYIASGFILNRSDFSVLNNIFGDKESRECISTSKCRIALLNYYKNKALGSEWKVYCRPKNIKPNNVHYPKLNANSKFTDFAVLIKNTQTNERQIVVFGFNDDESVAWAKDSSAPVEGFISNVFLDYNGQISVSYTN